MVEFTADLQFGADGKLWVTSNQDHRLAEIDVESNQKLVHDLAPFNIQGPADVAFSPQRYSAKVKGKITDRDGVTRNIREQVELSYAPGSGMLMVRYLPLASEDDLGPQFAESASVLYGYELGAANKRVLDMLEVEALAQSNGTARVRLRSRGRVDPLTGLYQVRKLSGALLIASSSRSFEGQLVAKIKLN